MVKNPPDNEGDVGSICGLGRSHGVGNGNPLQYSCLQNPRGQRSLDAGVQPRLIQGIRSGDGIGDLFNYLFIKDIKSNRIRIAQ